MSQEIHLGNVLSTEGNLINMDKAKTDLKSKTVAIMNNFNNVSFQSKVPMSNSQCMALYGSQLWNLSDSNINKLSITWRKSVRYLVGLPPRTSSYILPYLMNSCNIVDIIMERQILFYIHIC